MANANEGRPALEVHPLVARFVKTLGEPPELATIEGYIGDASHADHVRIYGDLEFSEWIDLPRASVVHVDKGEGDDPATIWIDAHVEVRHVTVDSERVRAEFLDGVFTEGLLAESTPMAPEVGGIALAITKNCKCVTVGGKFGCFVSVTKNVTPFTPFLITPFLPDKKKKKKDKKKDKKDKDDKKSEGGQ